MHNGGPVTEAVYLHEVPALLELRVIEKPWQHGAIETEDAAFDAYFSIQGTRSAWQWASTHVLQAAVRKRLAQFSLGQLVAFSYERGSTRLVWRNWETNPARLDEALTLLKTSAK
jgi:hypothetical protein